MPDLVKDGEVAFGEWLPDLPAYRNPGIVEAKNCQPVDEYYQDFAQLLPAGDALASDPVGAFSAIDGNGDPVVYAGTLTGLYQKTGSTWTDRSPAPYTTISPNRWHFAQFDTYLIATNFDDVPQRVVVGASSNFANLASTGTAPNAKHVGVINRFVLLGDIDDGTPYPYGVQWCAIDDVTDWPTPGTIDARTKQAGRELLDSVHGAVTGITNGQFYGLVFQRRAISRFTYVGGDNVFQVDTFEHQRGCWAPESLVEIGNRVYFMANDGWYMTDGQSITAIGNGKIDTTFFSWLSQAYLYLISAGINWETKCIYWSFPTDSAAAGTCDRILIYNFARDRFSWAENTIQLMIQSYTQSLTLEDLDALYADLDSIPVSLDSPLFQGGIPAVQAFQGGKIGTFTGAKLEATFDTGEIDGNPLGYAYLSGVKPKVTGNPTSITVALAVRNDQDNEGITFGTPSTRNARSRVCDFRTQGRFISARTVVTGGFDRAIGIDFDATEGDQV